MLRTIDAFTRPTTHPQEFAPMPARVIHFGSDDCHRLMVLESAGYVVEDSDGLTQLRGLLQDGAAVDALLVSEGDGAQLGGAQLGKRVSLQDVVAAARAHSSI